MNIAIGSAFRNSAGPQLSRYVAQMTQLQTRLRREGHTLTWIATEGDSVDDTRMEILRYAKYVPIDTRIVIREHGLPWFGSTEATERMRALSYVGNGILEGVAEDVDTLIYVESDLIWTAETMLRLITKLSAAREVNPCVGVISPLIFAGELFYDIWAFRKDGERFSPLPPYHTGLSPEGTTTMDSVGSCLVMTGHVARTCRMRNGGALVDFCGDVRHQGFQIVCDAQERVEHPA